MISVEGDDLRTQREGLCCRVDSDGGGNGRYITE